MDDLSRLKRSLHQQKEELHQELTLHQQELHTRFERARKEESELLEQERDFSLREAEFKEEDRLLSLDNQRYHSQAEREGIERELFKREADKLNAQALKDQADSEKIGFFKANKDKLRDDLRVLREELERERDSLREDRIRMEMHKNELRTRQKTIETMRFEVISNQQMTNGLPGGLAASQARTTGNAQNEDPNQPTVARDIQYHRLVQRYSGGPAFYPINPLPQSSTPQGSQEDQRRIEQARSLIQRAQASEGTIAQVLHGPRFSYEEYMRNLKLQLNLKSSSDAAAGNNAMSDFQLYIAREREAYLKSLNDNSSILNNNSHYMPENPLLYGDGGKSSFIGGVGSLQNSGYNAMSNKWWNSTELSPQL